MLPNLLIQSCSIFHTEHTNQSDFLEFEIENSDEICSEKSQQFSAKKTERTSSKSQVHCVEVYVFYTYFRICRPMPHITSHACLSQL
jgi:hypothetical protein